MLDKILKFLSSLENKKEEKTVERKQEILEKNRKFRIPKGYNLYVVAYDISETKIRNKVFKELKKLGIHTQYSVFEVVAKPQKIKILRSILEKHTKEANGSLIICKVNIKGFKYLSFRYQDIVFILD